MKIQIETLKKSIVGYDVTIKVTEELESHIESIQCYDDNPEEEDGRTTHSESLKINGYIGDQIATADLILQFEVIFKGEVLVRSPKEGDILEGFILN